MKPLPGKTIKIELKNEVWSDTVDYTLFISDSSSEELLSKVKELL